MEQQYIIRLGEFYTTFPQDIGYFISGSKLKDAWIEAEWFDGESVIYQVLDSKHMASAIKAHEAAVEAVDIAKIRQIMCDNPDYFVGVA